MGSKLIKWAHCDYGNTTACMLVHYRHDPSTPDLNKYGYQHKVYFDMQFADWKHLISNIINTSIMFISWLFNLQFPEASEGSSNKGVA